MNNPEVKMWRQIRARGRARFVGGIVLRRSLWLSVPFAITLLVTGLQPEHDGGFWSNFEFLAWAFTGVSLFIGIGDGLFLWRMRERDYQREQLPPGRHSSAFGQRSHGKRDLNTVSDPQG